MANITNDRNTTLLASSPRNLLTDGNIDIVLSDPVIVITSDSSGVPVNYTNTDSTIKVFNNNQPVAYGSTPGTYSVTSYSITPVGSVDVFTGTASGNIYTIPGISSMSSTVDSALVTYTISVKDTDTAGTSAIFYVSQTINKVKNGAAGTAGAAAISAQLSNEAHLIPIAITGVGNFNGCNTSMSVFIGNIDDSNNWNYLATPSAGVTIGQVSYVRFQNVTDMSTDVGTVTIVASKPNYPSITKVFTITKGVAGAVSSNLSNDSHLVPTTTAGVSNFSGCNTSMSVFIGNIDDSNNWNYLATPSAGVTIGQVSYVRFQNVTDMSTDVGTVTIVASKPNYPSITEVFSISKALQGTVGPAGQRSITISAFAWGTSKPASTGAITYTWSTGAVSAYPVGWTASAGASTATGQTLYMVNLLITDLTGSATSTITDWSNATSNTVGYRQDGSIGPQGASARVAYYVTTSASPPATPTSTGDSAPSGWSLTATSSLSEGYYMYQSDGLLASNGTITWGPPYLSNLKVGSLSAISANMGTVTISTVGSVASSGKGYGYGDGFFLGYSDGYKFDVGNYSNYIRWDGSNLNIRGNITGASSINITGNAIFGGSGTSGYSGIGTVGVYANSDGLADLGILTTSYDYGYGIYAIGNTGASAVGGSINEYGANTGVGWGGSFSNNIGNNINGGALIAGGPSKFTGEIYSTVSTGTAPIRVESRSICPNLFAEMATKVYNNGYAVYMLTQNAGVALQDDNQFVHFKNNVPYWVSTPNVSDIRLKNLIYEKPEGLNTINKLEVVKYTWKNPILSKTPGAVYTGLIAQEVEKVIPTAISIIEDTYLLDKAEIIPFLVKAVQELHTKVTELEAQIRIKNG